MYRYVGPADLAALARPDGAGALGSWVVRQSAEDMAEPFTYVVDPEGRLRLAARRSEHVVCAAGGPVDGRGDHQPVHRLLPRRHVLARGGARLRPGRP